MVRQAIDLPFGGWQGGKRGRATLGLAFASTAGRADPPLVIAGRNVLF